MATLAIQKQLDAVTERDAVHREALADLLKGTHTVVEIALRLDIRPKSVYELCRRFDVASGVRHKWPWRRKGHRGRQHKPYKN